MPAVTVIVDVPEPDAAIEVGLKTTWMPPNWKKPPCTEADKVVAEEKPFSATLVIVEVPEWFLATVTWVGEALMVKSALAAAATVRVTVVACVTLPPVPVTVIG